jgi:hypothetical protein
MHDFRSGRVLFLSLKHISTLFCPGGDQCTGGSPDEHVLFKYLRKQMKVKSIDIPKNNTSSSVQYSTVVMVGLRYYCNKSVLVMLPYRNQNRMQVIILTRREYKPG